MSRQHLQVAELVEKFAGSSGNASTTFKRAVSCFRDLVNDNFFFNNTLQSQIFGTLYSNDSKLNHDEISSFFIHTKESLK